jgi:hypothetical protein
MISLDKDDELENGLSPRMERTEKHVTPRNESDVYVVKTSTSRSLDRPVVVIFCPEPNDRSTWLRSIIIEIEPYHRSIRFIKVCPRITKTITGSDACAERPANGRERYNYRSSDDQLLIVSNTIDFLCRSRSGRTSTAYSVRVKSFEWGLKVSIWHGFHGSVDRPWKAIWSVNNMAAIVDDWNRSLSDPLKNDRI